MSLLTVPTRPSTPACRAGARITLLLLCVLALCAGWLLGAPSALAAPPRSIAVEDTTGDLHAQPLTERLQGIEFREDVDLVALSIDVTRTGQDPANDRALNDAVLAYARGRHPEWLTEGGAYWRESLVIVAIDPDNRFVGTYAGENVKLADGQFESIQEEMRPAARSGDWDGAIVDGTARYASLLARPFYRNPAFLIGLLAAGAAALAAVGAALARGAASRRRVDEALPRYDDVMLRYAETELAARTIPAESAYGEPVLRDYEEFTRQTAEVTRMREEIPGRRGPLWGISAGTADLSRRFAAATARIDAIDDEIAATNDLLSRSNRWRDAWELEVRPVLDSLEKVDQAVMQEPHLADAPTARSLREVAARVRDGLDTTTRRLESREMTPDEALAELDLMTSALGRAATAHRDAVIAATARDDREAEIMREAGRRPTAEDARYGTIRGRRRHHHPSAYDTYWTLSPILWLSTWQHSASRDLDTHRNPPQSSSSSGGFTGYSGGGGGFSGAGSSGRF